MDLQAWHYFLALERDFVETTDFVEPRSANFATFSNAYAKLLLLVGSEVDVVAKQLCAGCPTGQSSSNIVQYQAAITSAFPGMHATTVKVSRYGLEFTPWQIWGAQSPTSPTWWKAYNEVKHSRDSSFDKANLGNLFDAFAGLLVLELYLYRRLDDLQPRPRLFDRGFPQTITTGSGHNLPGLTYTNDGAFANWEMPYTPVDQF